MHKASETWKGLDSWGNGDRNSESEADMREDGFWLGWVGPCRLGFKEHGLIFWGVGRQDRDQVILTQNSPALIHQAPPREYLNIPTWLGSGGSNSTEADLTPRKFILHLSACLSLLSTIVCCPSELLHALKSVFLIFCLEQSIQDLQGSR